MTGDPTPSSTSGTAADADESTEPTASDRVRAVRGETDATLAFVIAFVIGAVVGAIAFWGTIAPLWTGWSIGALAAITAAVLGLAAAYVSYWRSRHAAGQQWRLDIPSWKFILDATAVAVVHAALAAVVIIAVFAVLQRSFIGFEADTFVAAIGVGLPAGLAVYWITVSCQTITTQRMSLLLVTYMALSVFASMLTASEPDWWRYHFSALGSFGDGSANLFNITLMVSGAMVTVFAMYLQRDLALLHERGVLRRARTANVVSTLFVIMGFLLAGVGIVSVPVSEVLHVTIACTMFFVFIGMLVAAPWLFEGMPRIVLYVTWGFLAAIVVAIVLYVPIGYFNLTAMEMVAFGLIFGWIVVFIRLETAAFAQAGGDEDETTTANEGAP